MDNYKARLLESKSRYELEMIINELCNELCIIIELLDIRYYQKLVNRIAVNNDVLELKADWIDELLSYLKDCSQIEFNESDE